MKRILDTLLSLIALTLAAPVLGLFCVLIFLQDRSSPLYIAPRIGINGKPFRMIKLRSMKVGADRLGIDSTAANDSRITIIGKIVRKYKIDELMQLFNVLKGDMSLVGPRPNVEREVQLYSTEETRLLAVKPGITDLASIVFSDEGEILRDSKDPDIDYHQLIRPWKSRLGILYIEHRSILLDLKIMALTAMALVSKSLALMLTSRLAQTLGASSDLVNVCRREKRLTPSIPPGCTEIVATRSRA